MRRNTNLAILVLCLLAIFPAQAMAFTWTWAGGTGNWNTNNWTRPLQNWELGYPGPTSGTPGTGDTAIINTGTVTVTTTPPSVILQSNSGTGTLNVNTGVGFTATNTNINGGTLNISNAGTGAANLGTTSIAGTLNITGGTVAAGAVTNTGTLTVTGALAASTVNSTGNLHVNAGGVLSATTVTASANNMTVAGTLSATNFNASGSWIDVSGTLNATTVNVSAGQLSVATAGTLTVSGLTTISGVGTLNSMTPIRVGNNLTGLAGNTNLSGLTVNGGSVTGAGVQIGVGSTSVGTVNFNGGSMNVPITVGHLAGSTGTLNVNNTLLLTAANSLIIGNGLNSIGTVNVSNTGSAGFVNMAGTGTIQLGNAAGTGILNIENGTVVMAATSGGLHMGNSANGTGTVNINNLGILQSSAVINIGNSFNAEGTLNINVGGILSSIENINVGTSGSSGTIHIDGGTIEGPYPAFAGGSPIAAIPIMTLGGAGGFGELTFGPNGGNVDLGSSTFVLGSGAGSVGEITVTYGGNFSSNVMQLGSGGEGTFKTYGVIGTVNLPTAFNTISNVVVGSNGTMIFNHFGMDPEFMLWVPSRLQGNINIEQLGGRTALGNGVTGAPGAGVLGTTLVSDGELAFAENALGDNLIGTGAITIINGGTLTWLSDLLEVRQDPMAVTPVALTNVGHTQDVSHRLIIDVGTLDMVDNQVIFGAIPTVTDASEVTIKSRPDTSESWQHIDNGGYLRLDIPFDPTPNAIQQGIRGVWTILGRLFNDYYLEIKTGATLIIADDSTFTNDFFVDIADGGTLRIETGGYFRNAHLLRNENGTIHNDGHIINAGTLYSPPGIEGDGTWSGHNHTYTPTERPEPGERGERGPRGRRGCNAGAFGLIALAGVMVFFKKKSA